MKRIWIFPLATLLILSPYLPAASGQTLNQQRQQQLIAPVPKLAPDLEELLAGDDEEKRQAMAGKTLAQIRQERRRQSRRQVPSEESETQQRARIGGLLIPSSEVMPEENQSFLVEYKETIPKVVLQEKVLRLGGTIRQTYSSSGLMTIEAPRTVIRQLAADEGVAYISPDRVVAATGHVKTTMGLWNVGIFDNSNPDPNTWMSGVGIGVAVLDSGIDTTHRLMKDSFGNNTVKYSADFTGQGVKGDPYGHGTHVATLLAGDGLFAALAYEGMASQSSLLSLRVLNENGQGTSSSVIAALNWCVLNKAAYNIRVINLSLGTLPRDSYRTDPLCLAARRAVNAGIVVVCSAGNNGLDITGRKIYGGIGSPAIDPSVITVGAANTYGTDARNDDSVTTYSSRGPTRGYKLVNNVRVYDNLIKPDLVAPGNKLIGAQSSYNGLDNQLVRAYPTLKTGSTLVSTEKVMYLSGSSMATPTVAGTVALMIQTNPNLTPSLIKAILMYTAQPLSGCNMLEQGAGEVNGDGAVRLARTIRTNLGALSNGSPLLRQDIMEVVPDGIYQLVNAVNGKCVNIAGASTTDGALAQLWDCHTGLNQQFEIRRLATGEYKITALHSGKVLTISGTGLAATIEQRTGTNTNQQKWVFRRTGDIGDYVEILSLQSGKAMSGQNSGNPLTPVKSSVWDRSARFTLKRIAPVASPSTSWLIPQISNINGEWIRWGQGVITNHGFLFGSALMTQWQSVYGTGQVLSDATTVFSGTFIRVPGKIVSTVGIRSGAVSVATSGQLWGTGIVFADGVALASGIVFADGQVLGDGQLLGDGIVFADGKTRINATLGTNSSKAILGDDTACMKPAF